MQRLVVWFGPSLGPQVDEAAMLTLQVLVTELVKCALRVVV